MYFVFDFVPFVLNIVLKHKVHKAKTQKATKIGFRSFYES